MVRQAKNASKDAELKAPKKKKEESERRSSVRKRRILPQEKRAKGKKSAINSVRLVDDFLNFSWSNAASLLVIYLIMDVLLLLGFARFRLLFVAVLCAGAYFLQKFHKAKLLWAWLTTLFSLFVIGILRYFSANEVVSHASDINIMSTVQMIEIFSVSSLLWTLIVLGIVFGAYMYYLKKSTRLKLTWEWGVALFNMVLFWGFMHIVFQSAA